VHLLGRGIPWGAGVHDQNAAARSRQHQGSRQTGGSATDHDHVVVRLVRVHAVRMLHKLLFAQHSLPFLGNAESMAAWTPQTLKSQRPSTK
jgi:hypothetical protein